MRRNFFRIQLRGLHGAYKLRQIIDSRHRNGALTISLRILRRRSIIIAIHEDSNPITLLHISHAQSLASTASSRQPPLHGAHPPNITYIFTINHYPTFPLFAPIGTRSNRSTERIYKRFWKAID